MERLVELNGKVKGHVNLYVTDGEVRASSEGPVTVNGIDIKFNAMGRIRKTYSNTEELFIEFGYISRENGWNGKKFVEVTSAARQALRKALTDIIEPIINDPEEMRQGKLTSLTNQYKGLMSQVGQKMLEIDKLRAEGEKLLEEIEKIQR